MTAQNMQRLIDAIGSLSPVWFDRRLDVLKEVTPIGEFAAVMAESDTFDISGTPTRVLKIDALIRAKTLAGRDKDKTGVMHLETVKKRQSRMPPPPPPP